MNWNRSQPLTKEVATFYLEKLLNRIEIAKNTTYDWPKACQEGTQHIHNLISWAKGEQGRSISPVTLKEILNEHYQDSLSQAKDLLGRCHEDALEEYPGLRKDWVNLEFLVTKLPDNLPQTIEEFRALHLPEIDALNISLWALYEEADIDLDLGDDGTDEMEQDLETIFNLLKIFTSQVEYDTVSYSENLLFWIAKEHLKYEYLNESAFNMSPYNPNYLICILNEIINRGNYYPTSIAIFVEDLLREFNLID